MKRVTLELGGSDPMIVCDDADMKKAVSGAVHGRFYNCGQTCTAAKRLLVFESVADEFIGQLKARVERLKVGNGMDEGTDMGPMNNRAQWEQIKTLVDEVREKGEGSVIAGGHAPDGEPYKSGFFYMPTLVTGVPPDSRLLREEVFGPVLPIVVVKDLDEAIERAKTRSTASAPLYGRKTWKRRGRLASGSSPGSPGSTSMSSCPRRCPSAASRRAA